ncbi:serine/threonine protein kinase [Myxococcus stipitatus]|uniref:serine/threonine-protein kinase n=1 Tax=Myxococcus stipitatus TaxID=83455 RepID=UPI003144DB31
MSATYRLTGRIETGELAELYEAIQAPSAEVVVKLFHPKTSDPAYALDLAETTRRLQPVRHPGVLHVVDMGVVRQRLAVVREDVDGYLLGTALQRLHTKEVVLPYTVALYIVIQLLEAVHQAHEAGVLHGALTPGNVVLGRNGTPAVCDFGAMSALLAVPQLRKSFAGRGRGTYRAPEVTRGEAASEVSDVYSLGAIAYELLTQREPVAPGSGVSTRRSEGLPPPSRLDRRINARLDPIILRALEPNAARRFRSCAEFANALRNFLSASGGMPGVEDVRRFVNELFPNEVSIASLAAPAFKEPFTLEPISGAEMDDLGAEESEASIVQRAPYSRALTEAEAGADTQEAAPGFEEYRPEDYEPAIAREPEPRAPQAPQEEWAETTQSGGAAVLEQGWEAPPGAAPPKPRRQLVPQGGSVGQGGTRVAARNARMRVVEDFSTPMPPDDDEEFSVAGRRAAARAKRPPPPVEKGPPTVPDAFPAVMSKGKARDDMAIPAPSSPALPASKSAPPNTNERKILRTQDRRGRMLAVAGALALVGLSTLLITTSRTEGEGGAPEPEVVAVPDDGPVGPPPPTPIHPPAPRPRAVAEAAAPAEPERAIEDAADEPVSHVKAPPKAQRGYLSVTTNMPAKVYLDGVLISRSTPLRRYPLRIGQHQVRVVALATSEPQEAAIRIQRGKDYQLSVLDFRPLSRR